MLEGQHLFGVARVVELGLCKRLPEVLCLDLALAAVQSGVTCVQLRENDSSTRDFVVMALALKEFLAPFNMPLVTNDRIDVALACGAHGVQLGQSDMPVALTRQWLPPDMFIGLSVENLDDVQRAASQPASR